MGNKASSFEKIDSILLILSRINQETDENSKILEENYQHATAILLIVEKLDELKALTKKTFTSVFDHLKSLDQINSALNDLLETDLRKPYYVDALLKYSQHATTLIAAFKRVEKTESLRFENWEEREKFNAFYVEMLLKKIKYLSTLPEVLIKLKEKQIPEVYIRSAVNHVSCLASFSESLIRLKEHNELNLPVWEGLIVPLKSDSSDEFLRSIDYANAIVQLQKLPKFYPLKPILIERPHAATMNHLVDALMRRELRAHPSNLGVPERRHNKVERIADDVANALGMLVDQSISLKKFAPYLINQPLKALELANCLLVLKKANYIRRKVAHVLAKQEFPSLKAINIIFNSLFNVNLLGKTQILSVLKLPRPDLLASTLTFLEQNYLNNKDNKEKLLKMASLPNALQNFKTRIMLSPNELNQEIFDTFYRKEKIQARYSAKLSPLQSHTFLKGTLVTQEFVLDNKGVEMASLEEVETNKAKDVSSANSQFSDVSIEKTSNSMARWL